MWPLSRMAFPLENFPFRMLSIEKPAVCGGDKSLLTYILNNFYSYVLYTIIILMLILDYLVIFQYYIYAHAINLSSNLIQAKLSLSVSCIISGPWRKYFCLICQKIGRLKSFIRQQQFYVFQIYTVRFQFCQAQIFFLRIQIRLHYVCDELHESSSNPC